MEILVIFILIFGLAGVIGNQYSMISRMRRIEEVLVEIRDKQ
ncbi:hypothetical protein PALU110988_24970 [Paenibacillus lupini]|nr:hypothetical protein [Paenibacillus lupini]